MSNPTPPIWHQMTPEEVAAATASDISTGLTAAAVEELRRRFGTNTMTVKGGPPVWLRFVRQFHSALVYVLLAAAALCFLLGETVDGFVILAVVLVNAVVGFVQEAKAERAIGALATLVTTEATVRREGQWHQVPSADLVPGDVVRLQSGDRVPADLRLFQVRSLQCDEAALTGESVPVEKIVDSLPAETSLADRRNLGFAGTLVTYGQAEGIVIATGDRTETGQVATLIAGVVELSTPLTQKITAFSKLLVWVILGLAAFTFGFGVLRGESATDMFMAAVALAVGAIPEGLPAAVTITLAVGVSRMARRRAIIRKLPAVETLGSTTVICSDKTGTLTKNEMTVAQVYCGGEWFDVGGSGYEPTGEILGRDDAKTDSLALRETVLAGMLCNDSQLVESDDGRWKVEGDPTEAALLVSARKAGLDRKQVETEQQRVDVIPFESEHMFMATLHAGDPRVIYKKGAVDRLLERCDRMLDAGGHERAVEVEAVRAAVDSMGSRGLRVLAFARRHLTDDDGPLTHDHVAGGLTFLGLQGMIDPPRPEAIAAIADCRKAGIAVKMITGDHAKTAAAVADQLGLGTPGVPAPPTITGRELTEWPDGDLPDLAERTVVFARVAPEQKLRLVQALQSRGHVVAMTGDGVNDAPALKQADIGVAMGVAGTDVAKGAAAMILTDDNFAAIEAAVEEGRTVFDNLLKFIVWTLPTNGGEALILLTAIFFGTVLPVLPIHLLWINMTTAVLLGLALAFEPQEPGIMDRPPRDPRRPLMTFPLLMRTGFVSLLMLIGAFGLFLLEQARFGTGVEEARTIVVNTIVFTEVFYLLNCRSLTHASWRMSWSGNPWIWLGIALTIGTQLLFTYAPWMNRWFQTAPIRPEAWLHLLAVGLTVFLAVELEKWIRYRGKVAAGE